MKKFSLLMAYLVAFIVVLPPTSAQDTYMVHFWESIDDYGAYMSPTSEGGSIIVGETEGMNTSLHFSLLITKTDRKGDRLWTKLYRGIADTEGKFGLEDSNGNIWATGDVYTGVGNYPPFIIKFDAAGNELFNQTYPGLHSFSHILETADQNFLFMGGDYDTNQNISVIRLLKVDENGNPLWSKTVNSSYLPTLVRAKATPDGGFIFLLTGGEMVKLDVSGNIEWTKRYNCDVCNPSASQVEAVSILPDNSGYILAGKTSVGNNRNLFIVKTNVNGDLIWSKLLNNNSSGAPVDVAATITNEYVIASTLGSEITLTKLDEDGNLLFSKGYGELGFVGYLYETKDRGLLLSAVISPPNRAYLTTILKTNHLGELKGCTTSTINLSEIAHNTTVTSLNITTTTNVTPTPAASPLVGGYIPTDYNYICTNPSYSGNIKILLEGNYDANTGLMQNTLRTNTPVLLPLEQPYNAAPWQYTGVEYFANTSEMPNDMVDWVLVEWRDPNTGIIIEQQAALLLTDGSLLSVEQINEPQQGLRFHYLNEGETYRLIVRHRNHVAVASSALVTINNFQFSYDFTTAQTQALGKEQLAEVAPNIYALHSGDVNADGIVNVVDYQDYVDQVGTIDNYISADINLNTSVSIDDFNLYQTNASILGIPMVRY